jgi:uncharacterized protein DUF4384/BON domain-containing protein
MAAGLLLYLLWPSGPSRRDVENVLGSFQCAHVVAKIRRGVVKLDGFVENDSQRELLRQKVAMVYGAKGVNNDVRVVPRPFCEAMETLESLPSSKKRNRFQLRLRPSKGCEAIYHSGEKLVVEVTAKKPLNYLYVDYYVADRLGVAHIFPNSQRPDADVKEAQAIAIGGNADESQWEIQEPFGLEMVTVLSSTKPLFAPAREDSEKAEDYLALLHQVLQHDGHDADVFAAYCFIRTDR